MEHFQPEGHIRTNDVPDLGGHLGQSPVAAADDPVQLLAEVRRTAGFPDWFNAPAHSQYIRIVVVGDQPFKPIRSRFGVVIEEGHDIGGTEAYSRVPGSGEPLGSAAL